MYHSKAIRTAAISPTLGSMAYQCRTHSEANNVLLHQYRRWCATCFGRRTWWQRYGSVSPHRRMTTGAMACLADRTPAGRRLNGRRDAKICAREVLHYVDGCNKLPPIAIFRRHTAVRNPLHVTAANPHPCTFLSLSSRCSCHESLMPPHP